MRRVLFISILATLLAAPAHAEFTLGGKVGTLGLGIEGTYAFSEKWGIRAGFNTFSYDFEDDVDGVSYQGDLDLSSFSLLGDFRPQGGGFRLTGGAVINGNEVGAVADPAPTYEIGDNIYTLEEVGVLSANAEFDSFAPYLGLGYDFGMQSNLRVYIDVGVLFQGDPGVGIDSTGGTLSDDPGLRADLDAEEQSFVEDLDGFELYPVLSIGLQYAFK
jgi:hypothetical protein